MSAPDLMDHALVALIVFGFDEEQIRDVLGLAEGEIAERLRPASAGSSERLDQRARR